MPTKISDITAYKYSAREIVNLIATDLRVPTKSIAFTFSADGTYCVSVDNSQVPKPEDTIDPYDAYRDSEGRLPPGMW